MNIPFFKPYISSNEIDAISRVLTSGKLSRGKEVEEFEKEFAGYVGKKYAIAINSGTSALHILVRVLGWGAGDEIITTPFSYVASSNALLFEGVTPVFVDIDPETLNIDPEKIEEKITPKTKGILVVHILGLPANAEKIQHIKNKYKLQIIEDACEAVGVPGVNFTVSTVGEATVYGFHENKQITSGGEGGMIVTDDAAIAKACWSMRDQGRSLDKDWIKKVTLGFNFRMTEMQAAFGREQLRFVDSILKRREEIAERYSNQLRGVAGVITPHEMTHDKRSWFLYFVLLEDENMRDSLHKTLSENAITSSVNYFPPIYNFPMYANCEKECHVADTMSGRLLALPMFYEMTNEQIDRVTSVIRDTLK